MQAPLNSLQFIDISLVLECSKLPTVFQIQQVLSEGRQSITLPTGCAPTATSLDAVSPHCCQGHHWAHTGHCPQAPPGLFLHRQPQSVSQQRTLPSQVQDLAFVLAEFHEVITVLFLQPVNIPLDDSHALEHIDWFYE